MRCSSADGRPMPRRILALAAIGTVENAVHILDGEAGTTIHPIGELVFYPEIGCRAERDAP